MANGTDCLLPTPGWISSKLGRYIPDAGLLKSCSRIARPIWGSANARVPASHLRLQPRRCALCNTTSFREISRETVQLSVAQQIWGVLQELVTAIAEVFGLLDEEVYDALINQSDELAHIAKFYNLKSAS